jgi:hypothetical protein
LRFQTGQLVLYRYGAAGRNRVASIACSPALPECEAPFAITEMGVEDAKD